MSLESGKSFGLISSLMFVILPALLVPTFIVLFFAGTFARTTIASVPLLVLFYTALAFLGLVSFILFMVAMHRLAEYYHEPAIFKNALYGLILSLVGAVVAVVLDIVFFSVVFGSMRVGAPFTASTIYGAIFVMLGFMAVVFVFSLVGAVFYMRAFNMLGDRSGAENFKTAGLLTIIGYALTILGVGIILVWVAWIFAVIGFHSLKATPPQSYTSTTSSVSPSVTASATPQKRYCPNCGAENAPSSEFCTNCGRHL